MNLFQLLIWSLSTSEGVFRAVDTVVQVISTGFPMR
jgi:hypothetical protein